MPHRSRIQPSLVILVPPCTMMLRRAYYVVTSTLCQALVKGPPRSILPTSTPYIACNLQLVLVADGTLSVIGLNLLLW